MVSLDPLWPVKVIALPGRGRGLVSTRWIGEGEVVLKEPPLAAAVTESCKEKCCSVCFRSGRGGARWAILELFHSEFVIFFCRFAECAGIWFHVPYVISHCIIGSGSATAAEGPRFEVSRKKI